MKWIITVALALALSLVLPATASAGSGFSRGCKVGYVSARTAPNSTFYMFYVRNCTTASPNPALKSGTFHTNTRAQNAFLLEAVRNGLKVDVWWTDVAASGGKSAYRKITQLRLLGK